MAAVIYTLKVMEEILGESQDTIYRRLVRAGREPCMRIGTAGVWKRADMEAVRNVAHGRPPKAKAKPKAAPRAKKT